MNEAERGTFQRAGGLVSRGGGQPRVETRLPGLAGMEALARDSERKPFVRRWTLIDESPKMKKPPPVVNDPSDTMDPELRRRIEQRAYSLWEADGRPEGRALNNWLQAEREMVDRSDIDEEKPAARKTGLSRQEWSETSDANRVKRTR
jgi:hypothetical protein